MSWRTDPDAVRCIKPVNSGNVHRFSPEEWSPADDDDPLAGRQCNGTAEPGSNLCGRHQPYLVTEKRKAAERLMLAGDIASRKLVGLMDDPDSRIQLRAAESVLDRIGLSARQNVSITSGAETSKFEQVLGRLFDVGERGEEESEEDVAGDPGTG